MNLYFLSEILSHIKIDGNYLGLSNKNLRVFESDKEPSLVEFLPVNSEFSPVYYSPNSNDVKRYLTPNGYLYYPVFSPRKDGAFKVLFQRQISFLSRQLTLTVTKDYGAKFYLDGAFHGVYEIPFIPTDFSFEIHADFLAVSFFKKKTALFVFGFSGTLEYFDVVDEFDFSSVLTVKKRHINSTLTTTLERWNLSSPFSLNSTEDEKEKDYNFINENLIPLAFFENAKIGATIKEIVTPNFYKKADNLRGFLGKIYTVIPSPASLSEVWILGENNLSVATLSMVNGLIDNVFIEDF